MAIASIRLRDALHRGIAVTVPRRMFLLDGPTASGSIGLTFDDGPHPVHTPRLLDALGAHGIAATFFVIGSRARQYPDLVRRIASEGHAIGNHTFSHGMPGQTPWWRLIDEVRRTSDLLAQITGEETTLFRPPYGKLSGPKLSCLWGAGQTVVLWNANPRDFACRSADEVRDWFLRRPLRGGDLVLMHDDRPHAADVIPDIASSARERGLTFSTVIPWVGRSAPDAETGGAIDRPGPE